MLRFGKNEGFKFLVEICGFLFFIVFNHFLIPLPEPELRSVMPCVGMLSIGLMELRVFRKGEVSLIYGE